MNEKNLTRVDFFDLWLYICAQLNPGEECMAVTGFTGVVK